MKTLRTVSILAAALLCTAAFGQKNYDWYKAPAEREVRRAIADWQDLKFGLFIHWGAYSQLGIVESWSICPELVSWQMNARPKDMPYFEYLKMYEDLPKTFNPTGFDPDNWAAAAQDAGIRYVVFSMKHHDGFCMYDTGLTDYKITGADCPFHENPDADVAAAVFRSFREHKVRTGAYLSVADWHNDDYWWRFLPPKDRYLNYDPALYPDKYRSFVDFLDGQVDEITSGRYGDIDLLWLDLCEISETYKIDYPWERIARTARNNQPNLITVARGTHGIYENYYTAEQKIPESVLDIPWECCMTMSQSWVWHNNPKFKSTGTLIRLLVEIVSKGGNFLLGVGPSPEGRLHETVYERLREIGDWMDVNSEGIYGTRPAAPYRDGDVWFTGKGDFVYAFYAPAAEDAGLPAEIFIKGVTPVPGRAVSLLGAKGSLKWKAADGGITVKIPKSLRAKLPCEHVWCVKVKVK